MLLHMDWRGTHTTGVCVCWGGGGKGCVHVLVCVQMCMYMCGKLYFIPSTMVVDIVYNNSSFVASL